MLLDNREFVTITYDKPFNYNYNSEISGFYVCYNYSIECDHGFTVDEWKSIGINKGKVPFLLLCPYSDSMLSISKQRFQNKAFPSTIFKIGITYK